MTATLPPKSGENVLLPKKGPRVSPVQRWGGKILKKPTRLPHAGSHSPKVCFLPQGPQAQWPPAVGPPPLVSLTSGLPCPPQAPVSGGLFAAGHPALCTPLPPPAPPTHTPQVHPFWCLPRQVCLASPFWVLFEGLCSLPQRALPQACCPRPGSQPLSPSALQPCYLGCGPAVPGL